MDADGLNGRDIAGLCVRAEALCRKLAPADLGDVPLYVVPQSTLPARLGRMSVCYGYTGEFLDLHLRDIIGAAWRGRGACMVLNDTRYDAPPEDFERLFLGTAVHELAHIVLRPKLYREWPDATPAQIRIDARRAVRSIPTAATAGAGPVPWHQHDIFFIRAALHLRRRAEREGIVFAPTQLCAGGRFGLSPGLLYEFALGDEPERLADAPFREVRRHDPPREFIQLWLEDTSRWERSSNEERESA